MLFLAVEFAIRPGPMACRPPVPAAQVQAGQAATRAVRIPLTAFLAYFSPQEQDGDHSYIQVQFNSTCNIVQKKEISDE